jgi:regulator of sigma E protease
MLTVLAFLLALGLLITVHEYGHYRAAIAFNVRVLRFSVGFGPVLRRWQPRHPRPGQDTEFTLCALPLGGYVRMLDEREAPVAPDQVHRAFNRAPLRARFAIVAAGPLANLALAVLLYAAASWWGQEAPRALLSAPVAGSLAERAGLLGGEEVLRVAEVDASGGALGAPEAPAEMEPVDSFDDLRWRLMRAAIEGSDLRLEVQPSGGGAPRTIALPLSALGATDADSALLRRIGIALPLSQPVIGRVVPGGAADRAGLQPGDRVLAAGALAVVDGQQLREWIRSQAGSGASDASGDSANAASLGANGGSDPRASAAAPPAGWRIVRAGREIELSVTPEIVQERGRAIGRVGAHVGAPPQMTLVRQGPWEGLVAGAQRTWEVSALSLRMLGRMVLGQASLSNLSGPLTIADYAGRSASQGLSPYLVFLAMVSVSLGVLNLLPLPVLDGGHLMYYLWELVTGRGVSDAWMERLQRAGVVILLAMMAIALFNDLTRLLNNP